MATQGGSHFDGAATHGGAGYEYYAPTSAPPSALPALPPSFESRSPAHFVTPAPLHSPRWSARCRRRWLDVARINGDLIRAPRRYFVIFVDISPRTDFEYFPAATNYEFDYALESFGQKQEDLSQYYAEQSSFSTTPTMQHPHLSAPYQHSLDHNYLPSPPAPLYPPPPTHPEQYLQPQSPEPLFDSAQSALFSSFLNTMAVDQEFLFNPILPEGMPSPPAALPPGIGLSEFQRHQRVVGESLGRSVGGLRLDSIGGNPRLDGRERRGRGKEVRRYHDEFEGEEEMLGTVKREEEKESEYRIENENEEVDEGEFEEFPTALGKGKTRRSPTIGKGAGGRGRGKKARLDDDDDFSDSQDQDRDAEMQQEYRDDEEGAHSPSYPSPPPAKSRKSSLTNSTKRGKRRPSAVTRSDSPLDEDSTSHSATPDAKRAPLTEGQKRSNHILSEQKRRNAIRSGFKDLVDLLTAGEAASTISIAPPPDPIEETTAGGKKKKAKGSGRGRGRKGEIGAGASKSVILEKASMYISWLRFGNEALEEEVARVEALALGR